MRKSKGLKVQSSTH